MPSHANLDHVVAAMRAQVAAIHAHETGARRARDPEEVHQVRVAVRRLRAILRASRPLFVEEWVAGLRRELDWLGSALGRLRDLETMASDGRSLQKFVYGEGCTVAGACQLPPPSGW